MNTHRPLLIVVVSVVSLVLLACGAVQAIAPTPTPEPTHTPVPPTETPPPTASPTDTAIPPTPTIEAIRGSNEPVVIGDFELSISAIDLSDNGHNGWVPANMTDDETVLTVEVTLNSGDLEQLSHLAVWVTDEGGKRTDSGTTLAVDSKNQVIWMFPVPQTSHSFVLYFPSGEAIDLSPLLP